VRVNCVVCVRASTAGAAALLVTYTRAGEVLGFLKDYLHPDDESLPGGGYSCCLGDCML
jgi:hypothetical protein